MIRSDLDEIEARCDANDISTLVVYIRELGRELDLLHRRWEHVKRACELYGQYTPMNLRDTARLFEHDGLLGLGAFLRSIAEAMGEK